MDVLQLSQIIPFRKSLRQLQLTSETACVIYMVFDEGPDEIVAVRMSPAYYQRPREEKCYITWQTFPKTHKEHKLIMSTYDFATIECICMENLCNTPETAMDFLKSEERILNSMIRVWERKARKPWKDSVAFNAVTITILGIAALLLMGNIILAVVVMRRRL